MKLRKIIIALIPVFLGLLIAAVLKSFVFINVRVPSESMFPTISVGDLMIGSKLAYCFDDPARGDIITFYSPEDKATMYVKRIIGLPGDTVIIKEGKVYINHSNTPLSEPYLNPADLPKDDYGPYEVPDGCYFVMGDNRNYSYDSRFWATTSFISKEDITSKILFKYYSNGKVAISNPN